MTFRQSSGIIGIWETIGRRHPSPFRERFEPMEAKTVTYGIRCSLKPKNREQERKLLQALGCRRFVYNHFLGINRDLHEKSEKFLSYNEMCRMLTLLKRTEDHEWLKDVPAQTLQQALKDLDEALKRFREGKGGFPTFRSRNVHDDTMRFPQYVEVFPDEGDIGDDRERLAQGRKEKKTVRGFVRLPKIGDVPCRLRRGVRNADIRHATVGYCRRNGRFHITFCCHVRIVEFPKTGKSIGLDGGAVRRWTDSDGRWSEALHKRENLARLHARLAREQRKFSDILRKWKASGKTDGKFGDLLRRKRLTIQSIWAKIRNIRKDIDDKESIGLIREYDLVAVEALRIGNMTRSAKGTVGKPGKNVRQKSGLNRNLLSNRLSEFYRKLEYKAEWYGKTFVRVDPKHTSQTCSACGHVDPMNRRTQAKFKCLSCGMEMNADHNAALNILHRAIQPPPGV